MRRLGTLTTTLALAAALLSASCGGDDTRTLTIYSGREEEIVAPLFQKFTAATGIKAEVRYGDSAELAASLAEEGSNSPADVFFAQDPGSLGAVDNLLAALPEAPLGRVPAQFRDAAGRWVGTSGRARVIVYNTDRLQEAEVPDTVAALTDPAWKGRIGVAPTNASFQAFVTGMRLALGDQAARDWLTALRANDAKTYEKNAPIVEAVAAGEIDLGLVNHYYVPLVKAEQPAAPIANRFLRAGDPGALVSVAGAGVLASSDHADDATAFVSWLLSDEGQRFYVDEAAETEYPLVAGIPAKAGLRPLAEMQGPAVDLTSFGAELSRTVEMLRETGFLT
jgi:iron(III) transport system substrate-binding protein